MTERSVSVLESIDDVNRNQWNNLVTQSDLGTVFHRHEWLQLVERKLDHEPRHVVVEKGSNPVAVFPNVYDRILVPGRESLSEYVPFRRLTSVTPGYGGPVITGDEDACLELLFEALGTLRDGKTLFHHTRMNELGYVRYAKTFRKFGYHPVGVHCRFRIDLTQSWADILANMESDHRRRIRKMQDHDVETRTSPLEDADVERTYEAYARNMARTDGTPFPFSFFEGLADQLGDRVVVFTTFVDGREVGRYVHLRDDERSTLHYYLGAIGDEANFEYNPSQLLHAAAIQWGQDNGYEYYDFGGTGAHYDDRLFEHKQGYGGEAIPTIQWRTGMSRVGWPLFKFAKGLYEKRTY